MVPAVSLGHSFPAGRRLRKRGEFLRVQQTGWRVSLPSFVLLVRARADGGAARLGITVTRKFGGAVARNRAKRLVREAFRLSPELAPDGIDLVVVPRAKARLGDLATVLDELRQAAPILHRRARELRAELAKLPNETQTAPSTRERPGP